MLSRNFRLQKVGDINWLFDNYDFSKVSHGLDEMIVIDVSRSERNVEKFCEILKVISRKCFIPITAGGGITEFSIATRYLRNGADKLLLGSAFHLNPNLCSHIASYYGRQCLVGMADYEIQSDGLRKIIISKGSLRLNYKLSDWISLMDTIGAGEVIVQSIDRDGTAMGLDIDVCNDISQDHDSPLILMGGIGKAEHIIQGLNISRVDGVSTANLFNFIGSTFLRIRDSLIGSEIKIASWEEQDYDNYHNIFNSNLSSK